MGGLRTVLNNFERYFSVALLTIILFVLTIQVIGRYFFNYTPEWSEELARYLFIWFIFVSASYAAKENVHIRIEAFNNIFPKAIRKWVAIAGELLWIAFNCIIIYISVVYTKGVFDSKQISVAVKINMGWAYLGIPFGYALLTIRIILNLLKDKIFNQTNLEL